MTVFNEQMESFIQMNDVQELARRALAEAAGAFRARSRAIYLEQDGELHLACKLGK